MSRDKHQKGGVPQSSGNGPPPDSGNKVSRDICAAEHLWSSWTSWSDDRVNSEFEPIPHNRKEPKLIHSGVGSRNNKCENGKARLIAAYLLFIINLAQLVCGFIKDSKNKGLSSICSMLRRHKSDILRLSKKGLYGLALVEAATFWAAFAVIVLLISVASWIIA